MKKYNDPQAKPIIGMEPEPKSNQVWKSSFYVRLLYTKNPYCTIESALPADSNK